MFRHRDHYQDFLTARDLRRDQLKHRLEWLGDTPAEVAEKLRRLGVKGSPCVTDCPVARFIGNGAKVGGIVATAPVPGFGDLSTTIRTPEPVQQFLALFDDGAFPDLIDA